jgi:hypothetical protein
VNSSSSFLPESFLTHPTITRTQRVIEEYKLIFSDKLGKQVGFFSYAARQGNFLLCYPCRESSNPRIIIQALYRILEKNSHGGMGAPKRKLRTSAEAVDLGHSSCQKNNSNPQHRAGDAARLSGTQHRGLITRKPTNTLLMSPIGGHNLATPAAFMITAAGGIRDSCSIVASQ